MKTKLVRVVFLTIIGCKCVTAVAEPPRELTSWLGEEQNWQRDTDGPIISLGEPGSFDDTHVFAPAVSYESRRFQLWYCGSTGRVAERVFHLGLANSKDGRVFERQSREPVYSFGNSKHSVLTPTLLVIDLL